MNISPISLFNNVSKINFGFLKSQSAASLLKNDGCDTVTFSSEERKNITPDVYKKDATKGKYLDCCYVVANMQNKDPKNEIEKFDETTEEIINRANKTMREAKEFKTQVTDAYRSFKNGTRVGKIGVESFFINKNGTTTIKLKTLPNEDGSSMFFTSSFAGDRLINVKVGNIHQNNSIIDKSYRYDKNTGKLLFYEEKRKLPNNDVEKLEMDFEKDEIETRKMSYKKGEVSPSYVLENKIEYDGSSEVSFVEYKKGDKAITKAITDDKVYLLSTAYDGEVTMQDYEFYRI